jgi:hypothetical protein
MSSSIALTVRSGIGTATATILSRLRDKELIPGPSPATSKSSLMSLQQKAFVAKKSGQVAGPNQDNFAGNTIFIVDAGADVEAGDL